MIVGMVRHPRGSFIVYPLLSPEAATPKKQNQVLRRCRLYARKSASRAVLSRMQFTLHATRPTPHGASRSVLTMSVWSMKARRPTYRNCRHARVYGHTTPAVHDMSTHTPLFCLRLTSASGATDSLFFVYPWYIDSRDKQRVSPMRSCSRDSTA